MSGQVAVALGYDWGGPAPPEILAAGTGAVAERILSVAQHSGIAVHRDPALAEVLAGLDLCSHVPQELWTAVAAVLSFLWHTDASVRAQSSATGKP